MGHVTLNVWHLPSFIRISQRTENSHWFLGAWVELRKVAIRHVCLSVCLCVSVHPNETTELPLYVFWWKLDIWTFLKKICRENSSFIKIRYEQRALYMKTFSLLWQCLAEFSLEWEMFQIKVLVKIKTHTLCFITFQENRAVYDIMWKNVVEPERPQMTIRRPVACWIIKATGA